VKTGIFTLPPYEFSIGERKRGQTSAPMKSKKVISLGLKFSVEFGIVSQK
jgi:hypothetical protein